MDARKIIFVIWLVIVVAGFSSIVFGKSGIIAMRKLESERDRLAVNMEQLREINGELEGALGDLRSDPDALTVYARELGYASTSDDRFIRISGLPAAGRRTAQAGNLLKAVRPEAVSDGDIRAFAILVGIAVSAFILSSRFRSVHRRRNSYRDHSTF